MIFSCDQAALLSVCPSIRLSILSVCHTFFTMFLSSYHHEILPLTKVISMPKVKVGGQRSRSQRSKPNLAISRQLFFKVNCEITRTQVEADRGALWIWRRVSLPKGGQKFWLQWQLADTAWLACARIAATRSAAERTSNTQSHSL